MWKRSNKTVQTNVQAGRGLILQMQLEVVRLYPGMAYSEVVALKGAELVDEDECVRHPGVSAMASVRLTRARNWGQLWEIASDWGKLVARLELPQAVRAKVGALMDAFRSQYTQALEQSLAQAREASELGEPEAPGEMSRRQRLAQARERQRSIFDLPGVLDERAA